jgi:hypothetical protein
MSGLDSQSTLLPFHRRMVEELISEDGLCILSCGMGWQRVVTVLLRLQLERRRDPREKGIVLILGCTDEQRRMIIKEVGKQLAEPSRSSNPGPATEQPEALPTRIVPSPEAQATEAEPEVVLLTPPEELSQSSNDDFKTQQPVAPAKPADGFPTLAPRGADMVPPADITADTPAAVRSEMYRTEAAVFVTTRILVVDMLSARLQPHQVEQSPGFGSQMPLKDKLSARLQPHQVEQFPGFGSQMPLKENGSEKQTISSFCTKYRTSRQHIMMLRDLI